MAAAYDAESSVAAGTGTLSWTHTPSGTPRGVLVLIGHTGGADEVTGVTYGGTAMSEVALSPLLATAGDEDGSAYGYFLGASVPAGAQTVEVSVDAGSNKRAVCYTVTAAADTEVADTTTVSSDALDDPSYDLDVPAGVASFNAAVFVSGLGNPENITEDADYTVSLSWDIGTRVVEWYRRTSTWGGGTETVTITTTAADDVCILAVAVRESAGGAPAGPPAGTHALLGVGT